FEIDDRCHSIRILVAEFFKCLFFCVSLSCIQPVVPRSQQLVCLQQQVCFFNLFLFFRVPFKEHFFLLNKKILGVYEKNIYYFENKSFFNIPTALCGGACCTCCICTCC